MLRKLLPVICLLAGVSLSAAEEIPTPESFLGHRVGADRKLAPYSRVLEYIDLVAQGSPRVSVEQAGVSTLGNEMRTVILTSESNQANLDRYRSIARRLANADELDPAEAEALAREGKVIALVTCTIHSTEVGSTQMAMEFVHDFATTRDPRKTAWMEDVILLLMPSINPDGQVMVVDWYDKHVGTEYEGGRMPWLYQPYVGHDNNRDFYMLTQKETQVVNNLLYHEWFPQVFVDEHQMGSSSVRMFVPPQTDPLAPEVHSLIFRQADLIGTNMSFRLEEAGKTGVGHNMIYDSYWPGGTRNTAWWKNVTGLLTEVASVRIASPIYIEPGELRGGRKGFPEYKRRANFPSPWPGGWWRLRDIVEYELIATWALAESASQYRQEILTNFGRMARESSESGLSEPPYAWIVAPDQHDPVAAAKLVDLLLRHGVRVSVADEELRVGRTRYPAGTLVIPAAQPYRAFLRTMLRPQRYPEVRPHKDGPIIPPYDVTSWSLPLSMGVEIVETSEPVTGDLSRIEEPLWPGGDVSPAEGGYVISHAADTAFTAINRLLESGRSVFWLSQAPSGGQVGDIYLPPHVIEVSELSRLSNELHLPIRGLEAEPEGRRWRLRPQRTGLYKPWRASMDEGWTRFLLESYEFPFLNLSNQQIEKGEFEELDVLLFPDVGKSLIEKGEPESEDARRFAAKMPPEYSGGIGVEGGDRIKTWVKAGGTVVALDSSSDYFIELFQLPVRNVLKGKNSTEFSAPGTTVRLLIDTTHPLGFGMREEEAGYFAGSPAFRTSVPDARFERRVVARYPEHRDDIRLSGYLAGAQLLERRAAVVEYAVGKGRVVLLGFRAQHRAQPLRTFKLLFNALLLGGLEEVPG
ncbi:MAG: M14 family metallopeptidase [Acidobacteriota bacterium]|nr:M14 family metallopeptidase [Acidobacteriota bacterium]